MSGPRSYVSVIGAANCSEQEYAVARELGRGVARMGAVLVCGGGGGVMEAAALGAHEVGGTTVGILPGHDRAAGNRYLDIVVTTGMGHARNLSVVSSGDAVVAVGGEYGTLSEIGLAAKIGRPVILLQSWKIERARAHNAAQKHDEAPAPGQAGLFVAESMAEALALLKKILPTLDVDTADVVDTTSNSGQSVLFSKRNVSGQETGHGKRRGPSQA